MSRSAVLAVATAAVLLGTVQVAAQPNRVPDATYSTLSDGSLVRMPEWTTFVQSGPPRRPVPLSTSYDVLLTGTSPWASAPSILVPGGLAATESRLNLLGTSYTQIVVSPTGEVVVVCGQTVMGWVPPCLLDGTNPVV